MNKKGFTLIEMIIAIAIFSLAIVLLYNIINLLEKKRDFEAKTYKSFHHFQKVKNLIEKDLMSQSGIYIDNAKNIAIFKTKNSLYGIGCPYVAYVLRKKRLYRVESYQKIDKNLRTSMLDKAKVLLLLNNCKKFSLFKEKSAVSVFIDLKKETIFKVESI